MSIFEIGVGDLWAAGAGLALMVGLVGTIILAARGDGPKR